MNPLTARQTEVLDFIRLNYRDKGYAPTMREIGMHLGIRSTNGVNDHLRALERKGVIRRDPAISRGIVLTEPLDTSEAPSEPREQSDLVVVPFPRSPGSSVKMDPKLLGLASSKL